MLYLCINTVMNGPFLHSYCISISFPRWKASCVVISFLVLLSISLCSYLVHFKNCPEYLTKGTVQVSIPFIGFLLFSWVSRSFLVLLGYSFFLILLFLLIWRCLLPIFPNICSFPFLRAFTFFIDLVVLFLPAYVISRFSLVDFSMKNSIPMSWVYILTACFQFFFCFG